MSENNEVDLGGWFPTYGIITAQRILERYKIRLSEEDLLYVAKNTGSFYHRLLQVPLKNVFNGIIMQQALDYQLYAQKLFIDYLLTGEDDKEENTPGQSIREELEEQRKELIKVNEQMEELEREQQKLIAHSQKLLIKSASLWQSKLKELAREIAEKLQKYSIYQPESKLLQALVNLLVQYDFKQPEEQAVAQENWALAEKTLSNPLNSEARMYITNKLYSLSAIMLQTQEGTAEFLHKSSQMNDALRAKRNEYRQFIVRTNELLHLLPMPPLDPELVRENRDTLIFDANLGENEKP